MGVFSVKQGQYNPSNAAIGIGCIKLFSSKGTVSVTITNQLMLYKEVPCLFWEQ
jgi:hypothetical protein